MNFLMIDDETVINLDAIASVSAGDKSGQFVTVIRYHAPANNGESAYSGLVSQWCLGTRRTRCSKVQSCGDFY